MSQQTKEKKLFAAMNSGDAGSMELKPMQVPEFKAVTTGEPYRDYCHCGSAGCPGSWLIYPDGHIEYDNAGGDEQYARRTRGN
jgi:hypothetical protein